MEASTAAYILFGLILVTVFGGIIRYYYSPKRHEKVEEAKYKMLDED